MPAIIWNTRPSLQPSHSHNQIGVTGRKLLNNIFDVIGLQSVCKFVSGSQHEQLERVMTSRVGLYRAFQSIFRRTPEQASEASLRGIDEFKKQSQCACTPGGAKRPQFIRWMFLVCVVDQCATFHRCERLRAHIRIIRWTFLVCVVDQCATFDIMWEVARFLRSFKILIILNTYNFSNRTFQPIFRTELSSREWARYNLSYG